MFAVSLLNWKWKTEKPAGCLPAGLVDLEIWWALLHQAVAVRRHGMSMMVVMAVMVAELHLFLTISENSAGVK
jgi:hypothetical protein